MMNVSRRFALAIAALTAGLFVPCGRAVVVPVSPVGGEVFRLLPDAQRKVLAGKTRVERQRALKGLDAKATSDSWRRSRPLVLKWKTTAGEDGPWRIRLAEKADLSDARELWLEKDWVKKDATGRVPPGEQVWSYEVPFANLDLGKTYYWQVWSNVSCPGHDCGFTYPDTCKCGRAKHGNISSVASFSTSAEPPRWIELEGKTKNVRDLGGWKAGGGRRVRTGMAFRGQGLNENSVAGRDRGRIRLTVEDVAYMTGTLGIKTDLDLRGSKETALMDGSPLGPLVTFIHRSSPYYSGMFHTSGKKTMAKNFRVFCDKKNYPIFFHCIGGADRTGSLAYVLNGVLGVAKEDVERDYESTFYNEGDIPGVEDPKHGRGTQHFDEGFAKYGKPGDTLQRRIELYLLDCGVTEKEIAAFRSIMLDATGRVPPKDATGRVPPEAPAWPEITAEMRPWCYNWWMGNAVDVEGLKVQARQMQEVGLGGFHVVPIYEAKDAAHKPVDYLSDDWKRLFASAEESGATHGLGVDMTTGCGWNFGGPHIASEQGVWRIARLGADDAPLKGGKVLWQGKDADGRDVRLEAVPTGRRVDRGPQSWRGPMIDPLSQEAMRMFLRPFDAAFAPPDASRPRCFYHDSYAYHETSWSPELPAAFKRLRGYPLEEHYAELAGIGDADTVARVKHDYRETISDMLIENFALWTQWAHGLNVRTRNQAHGAPANLLDFYAAADIPETEMFNTARDILMSKFASSPAHVRGSRLVSSESCTWIDEHFCATLDACKRFIDQLFLSGVNHVFYHGWCYAPPDATWPGWCFYATLEMNPRNPIFRDARTLSDWIARVQSLAQTSEPDEDVLLYWPVHDIWRKPDGFAEQFVLLRAGEWLRRTEFGKVARRLYDAGVSFDYISDRQLLSLPSKDKTHYTTIVIPPCQTIPLATAMHLGELARQGYRVVCVGERPRDVPGLIRPQDPDAVRKAMKGVTDAHIETIGRREPFTAKSGLAYRRLRRGKDVLYYVVNQTAEKVSGAFRPTAATTAAWILDPMNGAICHANVADGTVSLELESGAGVWLWCETTEVIAKPRMRDVARPPRPCRKGEGALATAGLETASANYQLPVTGPWSLTPVCGGPDGSFPVRTMRTLSSWSRNADGSENPFCGTVCYKTTFDWHEAKRGACLDLGKVCHSARVRVNGRELGVRIMPPYTFEIPADVLKVGANDLEVEVTSTGANRLRDLDKRKVEWRVFTHPGVIGRNYKPFDASEWPLAEAGLFGPVSLGSR